VSAAVASILEAYSIYSAGLGSLPKIALIPASSANVK